MVLTAAGLHLAFRTWQEQLNEFLGTLFKIAFEVCPKHGLMPGKNEPWVALVVNVALGGLR